MKKKKGRAMQRFKNFLTEKRQIEHPDPIKVFTHPEGGEAWPDYQPGSSMKSYAQKVIPRIGVGGAGLAKGARLVAAARFGNKIIAGKSGGSHSELPIKDLGKPDELGFAHKDIEKEPNIPGEHGGMFWPRDKASEIVRRHPELSSDPASVVSEKKPWQLQSYDVAPEGGSIHDITQKALRGGTPDNPSFLPSPAGALGGLGRTVMGLGKVIQNEPKPIEPPPAPREPVHYKFAKNPENIGGEIRSPTGEQTGQMQTTNLPQSRKTSLDWIENTPKGTVEGQRGGTGTGAMREILRQARERAYQQADAAGQPRPNTLEGYRLSGAKSNFPFGEKRMQRFNMNKLESEGGPKVKKEKPESLGMNIYDKDKQVGSVLAYPGNQNPKTMDIGHIENTSGQRFGPGKMRQVLRQVRDQYNADNKAAGMPPAETVWGHRISGARHGDRVFKAARLEKEGGETTVPKSNNKLNPDKMPDTASPGRKALRSIVPGLGSYDAASRHAYDEMGGAKGGYIGGFMGQLLSGTPKDYYKNRPDPNSLTAGFKGGGQAQAASSSSKEQPETLPQFAPKNDSILTAREPPQTTKKTSQFGPIDRIRSHYSQWSNPAVKPWDLSPSTPMNPSSPSPQFKGPGKYIQPEGGKSIKPAPKPIPPGEGIKIQPPSGKGGISYPNPSLQPSDPPPTGGSGYSNPPAESGAPAPTKPAAPPTSIRAPGKQTPFAQQLGSGWGPYQHHAQGHAYETNPKMPVTIRTNNPGAQWPGPASHAAGSEHSIKLSDKQGNRAAVFDNPVQGATAQFDLLGKYADKGPTINKAIKDWSGHNSAATYAQKMGETLGRSPTEPLKRSDIDTPSTGIDLAKKQAGWETGKPYPMSDDQWSQAHTNYLGTRGFTPESGKKRAEGGADIYNPNKPAGKFDLLGPGALSNRLPMPSLSPSTRPSAKQPNVSSMIQHPVMKPSQNFHYSDGTIAPFNPGKPMQPESPNWNKDPDLHPDIRPPSSQGLDLPNTSHESKLMAKEPIQSEGGKKPKRSHEHGGMLFYAPWEK